MKKKEMIIGNMIRYFLKENNMTMKELGKKLGKSESTVSKWISGSSTPMAKDLSELTFIFNIDINTLLYGIPSTHYNLPTKLQETMSQLSDYRVKKVMSYAEELLKEQELEEDKGLDDELNVLLDEYAEKHGIDSLDNLFDEIMEQRRKKDTDQNQSQA